MAPSAELSLRYLPDLSTPLSDGDTTAQANFSDSSFQIPTGTTNDLLADTTINFLGNDTLSTPVLSTVQRSTARAAIPDIHTSTNTKPLTLAELTPRREKLRQPVRSSLRLRQKAEVSIPTTLRTAVINDLTAALEEDLSPLRPRMRSQAPTLALPQEESFQIPLGSKLGALLADESDFLAGKDLSLGGLSKQEPLTLSELTPRRPKVPVTDEHANVPRLDTVDDMLHFLRAESGKLEDDNSHTVVPEIPGGTLLAGGTDSDHCKPSAQPTSKPEPPLQADVPMGKIDKAKDHITPPEPSSSRTTTSSEIPANQRKNGKKTRRKGSVIGGGISKTGKAKVAQTTLARVLTRNVGKGGVRQNPKGVELPLQSKTSSSSNFVDHEPGQRTRGATIASASSGSASETRPAAGGLAATLMAYGAKIVYGAGETVLDDDQDASAGMPGIREPGEKTELGVDVGKGPVPGPSLSQPLASDRVLGRHSPLAAPQLSPAPTTAATGTGDPPVQDKKTLNSGWGTSSGPGRSASSLRSSIKRPTSDVSDPPSPRHKRSRLAPASGPSEPASLNELPKRTRPLRASRLKNTAPGAATSLASSASAPLLARVPSAPPAPQPHADHPSKIKASDHTAKTRLFTSSRNLAVHRPVEAVHAHTTTGQLTTSSSASSTAFRASSRSGDLHRPLGENVPDAASAPRSQGEGFMRKPGEMPVFDKPAVSLPAAKPTRPVEFHFQSDARLEARLGKSEASERAASASSTGRPHAPTHHPVPDFKAMHALQESQTLARKEQIAPVIPVPIEFATDVRAREREKFEEGRRERERALEALMEERRREKELEEELEVKEMRRRAIPRANEVPEWYATAPKRTKNT